jgi:NADH/NAD ratio-sensing transcriptional regulator Rex
MPDANGEENENIGEQEQRDIKCEVDGRLGAFGEQEDMKLGAMTVSTKHAREEAQSMKQKGQLDDSE